MSKKSKGLTLDEGNNLGKNGVKASLYPEWESQAQEKIDAVSWVNDKKSKRMHLLHGSAPGAKNDGLTCMSCIYLVEVKDLMNVAHTKCKKYSLSYEPSTDWSRSLPACGLYEPGDEKERRFGNDWL